MTAPDPGRLDLLLERAQRDLMVASGGAALCALSRGGRSVPAAKYHEGRWAALRALQRLAARGGGEDEVAALVEEWRDGLAGAEARGTSADWTAYYTGGVDGLTEALDSTPGTTT